jgi:hypothetical protein
VAGDEASDLFGDETGLPMIQCPECKRERVIERQSKKQNENLGRVYVKYPMNSGVSGCVFIPRPSSAISRSPTPTRSAPPPTTLPRSPTPPPASNALLPTSVPSRWPHRGAVP